MHAAAIVFLIMTMIVMPLVAKRIGNVPPQVVAPVVPKPVLPQPAPQPSLAAKNEIVARLDVLLQDSVLNDEWYKSVNDLVVDLVLLDKALSVEYLKKIHVKIANVATEKAAQKAASMPIEPKIAPIIRPAASTPAAPTLLLSKNGIVAQLDEKLRSTTIDDAWHEQVNNLIFDLALLDRNASQEYLKKIRAKMSPVIVLQPSAPIVEPAKKEPAASPAPPVPTMPATPVSEPMQRGTPPPPPPAVKKNIPAPPSAGGMQKGTPPPPPPAPVAGAKKGGTPPPPPPPPGPMVKGKKGSASKEKASPAAPAAKGPEPLLVTVSYGAPQLAKRSNEEIIDLFTKLLDALATRGDFWDAIKKEPMPEWRNRIDTVKKALSDPKRNITMNVVQMIEDRIKQVRTEKAQQGLQKQESAEKEKQKSEMPEYTREELIAQIVALKKRADPSDFKWLIEFQGTIKKLDKLNHEEASQYEDEFIKKYPGQKAFLPKKKEAAVVKELTEEEKLITTIDTILKDKPVLWAIKVREPIQALYDINPAKGIEYQDKYIAATEQAAGKADKPFLKIKE